MDNEDAGLIFRDVLFLALIGFVCVAILMLPWINPVAKEGDPQQGQVMVEIDWPYEVDVDVDLWVKAPGDMPVGYSNKGGLFFNLLRDDLGNAADRTLYNHEVAISRGMPNGEYTVNLHLFRNTVNIWPVPVTVTVTLADEKRGYARRDRIVTNVDLKKIGEELTVMNFTLADGHLDHGSVSHVFVPLREWRIAK